MFDQRLARVMHQDQINSAEIQRRRKGYRSERFDWKALLIVTMIAGIFSPRDVPEVNRDLSAPRYRFQEECGRH